MNIEICFYYILMKVRSEEKPSFQKAYWWTWNRFLKSLNSGGIPSASVISFFSFCCFLWGQQWCSFHRTCDSEESAGRLRCSSFWMLRFSASKKQKCSLFFSLQLHHHFEIRKHQRPKKIRLLWWSRHVTLWTDSNKIWHFI